MRKNFAIIGAAGYIAERHMRAIRDIGGTVVAACDEYDVMGRIDSYFPYAKFFLFEHVFDKYISSLRDTKDQVDYVVVCTPNYQHYKHILMGLSCGANVICEKPIVLETRFIPKISEYEEKVGKKAYTILQLREHPTIKRLKEKVDIEADKLTPYDVKINYITSRGDWYHSSWKSDIRKSGGLATNIGIHLFDMLMYIFGTVEDVTVLYHDSETITGVLKLTHANVTWKLSIDEFELEKNTRQAGKRTFRELVVNGEAYEFSNGFTNLHNVSYEKIMQGNGHTAFDAYGAIALVEHIRSVTQD